MKWISIVDKFPTGHHIAYFITGHEWIGIGIWEDKKGWVKGFIGDFPGDFGSLVEDDDPFDINNYLNQNVMWWSEIEDYPCYGKKMSSVIERLKK